MSPLADSPGARRTLRLALGAILATTGCAANPSVDELRGDFACGRARGHLLDDVGEVSQERRGHCGPAALAAVAMCHGIDTSTEQLAPETYLPEVNGTFTFDLERAARAIGLAPRAHYGCTVESVIGWVDAGVPVIVLRDVGQWPLTSNHYQIVIGYDLGRGLIVVKDATHAGAVLSFAEFTARWGQQYALAVLSQAQVAAAVAAARAEDEGDLERARQLYEEHVSRFPADLEPGFNLARLASARGDLAAAESRYQQILTLYPDDGPTANNLADVIRRRAGDLAWAELLVRHSIEVDPRNAYYYRETLAEVLRDRGRTQDARVEAEAALGDARNTDADLHDRLQRMLVQLRGPPER